MRIGGTDFDRATTRTGDAASRQGDRPLKAMGPGTSPTPNAIFNDLATWEKIPFLYTPQNRRLAAEMVRMARHPDKLSRLAKVLEDELGHELAFAVERGKIAANGGADEASIVLDHVQPDLAVPLSADALADSLVRHADTLAQAARETLKAASLDATRIEKVVYVGGSSLMSMVTHRMKQEFPEAVHSFSEVFTAVADGLALAAGGAAPVRPVESNAAR